jgi:hypothetical protein
LRISVDRVVDISTEAPASLASSQTSMNSAWRKFRKFRFASTKPLSFVRGSPAAS